ncbi:hypothetical protein [Streptosporangium sp. NPDC000509]|uniref:hypothetical protein n=1 Tax=Streptosporangium sp. NPDC000509 TaxID=3366186 RepID=UPI0036945862
MMLMECYVNLPSFRLVMALTLSISMTFGCGARQSPAGGNGQTTGTTYRIDTSVLRTMTVDYDHKSSPEELVKSRDHEAIVIGSVEGFEQGRDIYDIDDDPYPDKRVVMHVRVDSTIKDNGIVNGGRVYVDLDQGGLYHDGTPSKSLDDFRKAVPAGVRVMLFLFSDRRTALRIEGAENGLPSGAVLVAPDPQGMVFDDGSKLVGGQEDLEGEWKAMGSIDEVALRVKKALGVE